MGNHNCIRFCKSRDKKKCTPLGGNEELALHIVTGHCWDGEDGPPQGRGGHDQQREHRRNSAHVTLVGSKTKTQQHWWAIWRVQGLENNTIERAGHSRQMREG